MERETPFLSGTDTRRSWSWLLATTIQCLRSAVDALCVQRSTWLSNTEWKARDRLHIIRSGHDPLMNIAATAGSGHRSPAVNNLPVCSKLPSDLQGASAGDDSLEWRAIDAVISDGRYQVSAGCHSTMKRICMATAQICRTQSEVIHSHTAQSLFVLDRS